MNKLDFKSKEKEDINSFIKELKKETYLKDYSINENNCNLLYNANLSHTNCLKCKGLDDCKNDPVGYEKIIAFNNNHYVLKAKQCAYYLNYLNEANNQNNVKLYNIPKRILESSFDKFDDYSDERKKALTYATKFINNYQRNKFMKGLYLYGLFGVGKTYFLAAIANELKKKGLKVILAYFPDLANSLKGAISNGTYEKMITELKEVDVLMLDDLGGEMLTSWLRDDVLGPILNYRVNEELPVFISSNLGVEELEHHFEQTKDESFKNQEDVFKASRLMNRIQSLVTLCNFGNKKYN